MNRSYVASRSLCTLGFAFSMLASLPAAGDEQEEFASPLERAVFHESNAERARHGVAALKLSKVLCRYARDWSAKMASGEVEFGHGEKGTKNEGKVRRRAAAAEMERSYYGGSENCHRQPRSEAEIEKQAADAVQSWLNSKDGHRENLLSDRQEYVGIGAAKSEDGRTYYTQIFLKRRKS